MLEGADKFNNLIGSVYYPDGDSLVDLSLELVKHVRGASNVDDFFLWHTVQYVFLSLISFLADLRGLGAWLPSMWSFLRTGRWTSIEV